MSKASARRLPCTHAFPGRASGARLLPSLLVLAPPRRVLPDRPRLPSARRQLVRGPLQGLWEYEVLGLVELEIENRKGSKHPWK